MAPLKFLEKDYAILDSNFQSFCASYSIYTVEDFLLQDLNPLIISAEQDPRLIEGINQVLSIIDKQHHQPWLNGLQFLEDALHNKNVLSTGFDGIDSLLGGGVREGQLTELVGPSTSGKTQVCLRIAATVAKQHMGRVIFVDTGNSFSPQRIEHFFGQISGSTNIKKVMSNILCHSVFDIFSLFDVLHQLEISLGSQGQGGDCVVRSIIVDSFSSLITPVLGGGGSQGHALMTSAGVLLKRLAHEHNIAAVVTNHMVAGVGNPKPALGETWKSIPHVRLLIARDSGQNIRTITVLKHTSQASGKATRFVIDD